MNIYYNLSTFLLFYLLSTFIIVITVIYYVTMSSQSFSISINGILMLIALLLYMIKQIGFVFVRK